MVAILARPGGNLTGLSIQSTDLAGKRIELLREVLPDLRRIAVIANIGDSSAVLETAEARRQPTNLESTSTCWKSGAPKR